MAPTLSQPVCPGPGLAELAAARQALCGAMTAAFAFSAFVNLLMLTAPLYMLQVYDRVLASRSVETLVALSLLAGFLFLIMGLLDHARGRVMARVGGRLQAGLEGRVLSAALRRLALFPQDAPALAAQRDLDAVARFWASPVLLALFDAPWTPVFIALLFVFHPWLGLLAIGGGVTLALITWANQRMTAAAVQSSTQAAHATDRLAEALKAEAEVIQALGMGAAVFARWQAGRALARDSGLAAADISGRWSVFSRTFRLFLQSAMLGLAAWLVLRDELSAGAMIAASILLGRALQPVEQAVGQWATVTEAAQAKARLAGLLAQVPPPVPRTPLPRPEARLEVQGLAVAAPGGPMLLRGVGFSLAPGQVMGVIGPSGAGKSTLARALVGVARPAAGRIRLDGADLGQYGSDALGALVGYLPQRVPLFDGTIAENIARLEAAPDPGQVIAAARAAGAHEMILDLPAGYDTPVSPHGSRLSGGQIQRLGLARALYGDPVLLVLDEPNASLDTEGAQALNLAIRAARARGAAVLVMAHRPAALQECDLLMVLKDGQMTACGPRDAVLRDAVRNAGDIARSIGQGATG